MFFDNIILFLNVLEQFAIRVTIFDLNIEDIIKYVNKTFLFGVDGVDYFNDNLLSKNQISFNSLNDPYIIVKNKYSALDAKMGNSIEIFHKLNYNPLYSGVIGEII